MENNGNTQNSNHTSKTNTMNTEKNLTSTEKNSKGTEKNTRNITTNITDHNPTRDGKNSNGNMLDYVSGDSTRSSSSHVFHKNNSEKSSQ